MLSICFIILHLQAVNALCLEKDKKTEQEAVNELNAIFEEISTEIFYRGNCDIYIGDTLFLNRRRSSIYMSYDIGVPLQIIEKPSLLKKVISHRENKNRYYEYIIQRLIGNTFSLYEKNKPLFSKYKLSDFQEIVYQSLLISKSTKSFTSYDNLPKSFFDERSLAQIKDFLENPFVDSLVIAQHIKEIGVAYLMKDTIGLSQLKYDVEANHMKKDSLKKTWDRLSYYVKNVMEIPDAESFSVQEILAIQDSVFKHRRDLLEREIMNTDSLYNELMDRNKNLPRIYERLSVVKIVADVIDELNRERFRGDSIRISEENIYNLSPLVSVIGQHYLYEYAPLLENILEEEFYSRMSWNILFVLARLQYKDYEERMIDLNKNRSDIGLAIQNLAEIRTQESLYALAFFLLLPQTDTRKYVFYHKPDSYFRLRNIIKNLPELKDANDENYKKIYDWMEENRGHYILYDEKY